MHSIVLAGGCFWGVEHFFEQFPALRTEVGYANGSCTPVTYREVCDGSGHAEAVRIEYPDSIALPQILAAYFTIIDPTSINRQGKDKGISYRTGIYTNDPKEACIAKLMLQDVQDSCDKPVSVEVGPLENFTTAEADHQKYLDHHPGGYCHLPLSVMRGHRLMTLREVMDHYPHLKAALQRCAKKMETSKKSSQS